MCKDLVQSRLAHIDQGLSAQVKSLDFGMIVNGHQVTSHWVIDWSVRVAIKLTTAAGA